MWFRTKRRLAELEKRIASLERAVENGTAPDIATPEVPDVIKKLGNTLGQAQAYNLAHSYVLSEIMRDIAQSQPDPHNYLESTFERISARADQAPLEEQAHAVSGEFRQTISRFFASIVKSLPA